MCFVSIRRINKYLSGDELVENKNDKGKDKNYPIKIDNAYFTWNETDENCTLKDISFKVKRKNLVAIVGTVGE